MDIDRARRPHPARRASATHDRPARAPSGPRTPARPAHPADLPGPSPSAADSPDSPDATSPVDAALAPPCPPPAHADAAVQTPSTPPPSSPPPAPTHRPPTTPQKSAPTTFIAPPPLMPPPTITFEPTPIPWKGLPFEAAQWTLSSFELQDIVSRAIRLSAQESFVRLLSLQALEVDIVQETQRLDAERSAAQAKWRFEVGRRTMLMHALNSSASSAPSAKFDGTDDGGGGNPVIAFIGQLASSIASCDALLSSILHFSDQQSQIAFIQQQHSASALAIALRKLNRTYERQGQELKRTQARVQILEDELEEAWREAERMAVEFDDFEQEVAASTDDDPDGTVPDAGAADTKGYDTGSFPALDARQDPDETGTLGDAIIDTDIAVVRGVTATAVASKATLLTSPGSPALSDKFDTKSIRSVKSTRRSIRDGPSHVSRLSAARTRSRTASNASLRLPKALRSAPSTQASPIDIPPIPARPPNHSFLDMDNAGHELARKALPPQRHPEPTKALPTLPHSAGLPPSRVPSIWIETDGPESTRLNGLDRSHSLQIFSSLMSRTPRKTRRSNLVMSLTESERSSESPVEGGTGSGSASSTGVSLGMRTGRGRGTGTTSPTSNSSPVSLPTHALMHFRGPSLSSSSQSVIGELARPGSAGARLTTTGDIRTPVATPRRSLMSRASSVILRRLSQAALGGNRAIGGGDGSGSGSKGMGLMTPPRSREALRLNGVGRPLERWKETGEGEGEGEGEVMLIGSLHAESLDAP